MSEVVERQVIYIVNNSYNIYAIIVGLVYVLCLFCVKFVSIHQLCYVQECVSRQKSGVPAAQEEDARLSQLYMLLLFVCFFVIITLTVIFLQTRCSRSENGGRRR